MKGAFLNGADLTGARFGRANLTDADLKNAIVIQSDTDVAILCRTRLPWGDINRDCDYCGVDCEQAFYRWASYDVVQPGFCLNQ